MKKVNRFDMAAISVIILWALYIAYAYPLLPLSVALRFDNNGIPTYYSSNTGFLTIESVLGGAVVLTYLILKLLPAIDPKRRVKYNDLAFQKMALAIVVFIAAIGTIMAYATVHGIFRLDKMVFSITGIFFAFIGNLLPNLRPNYFAGSRTPWTLENADTWRATHRLAGKLWFFGGILLTFMLLEIPGTAANIIFLMMIAVLVIIPVGYSYFFYKKQKVDGKDLG